MGSTANRFFPDTSVEIASFCSVRNSRDVPSSHKRLRDSSRAKSKLTTSLSTEFAMFLTRTNETKLTDRQYDRQGQAAPIRNSVRGRTEFPKRTMTSGRRDFLRSTPPLSFLLPIIHSLGKTFFLSPVFHCIKNSRWRLNFLRCERSLEKISPAL